MNLLLALFISLQPGIYQPSGGNNDSICPQKVRPQYVDGRLDSLKVVYVGDCYYWGPFEYECQESTCSDGSIFFKIKSSNRYHWINSSYGIEADFSL